MAPGKQGFSRSGSDGQLRSWSGGACPREGGGRPSPSLPAASAKLRDKANPGQPNSWDGRPAPTMTLERNARVVRQNVLSAKAGPTTLSHFAMVGSADPRRVATVTRTSFRPVRRRPIHEFAGAARYFSREALRRKPYTEYTEFRGGRGESVATCLCPP